MFDVLRKSLRIGVVTTRYPETPPELSSRARGRPEIDWANWKDARPAAEVCPTGAIGFADREGERRTWLDLAKCTFCGLCAEVDPAIRMTRICECAARRRPDLVAGAIFRLRPDGRHEGLIASPSAGFPLGVLAAAERASHDPSGSSRREEAHFFPPESQSLLTSAPTVHCPEARSGSAEASLESLGQEIKTRARQLFGRSLHIREVDAGSCNGCEVEIVGLNSPIYDLERFGIHFVASPRHADLLLVTGPVTRNMELALRKTYDATPEPRLVVAVGACGCSGGIFGRNYAICGGVDDVLPVDVYLPGCPPNPHALLHGILTAIGRVPSPS